MSLNTDRVRELLYYDLETGVFTWRVDRPGVCAGSVAGSLDGKGYLRISLFDKPYRAHRLAWLMVYGDWPASELDHINRVKTDNRISNLRESTRSQNLQNRPVFKNNTSGYTGVGWRSKEGRWRARVTVSGLRKELGFFDSPEAANTAIQEHSKR